MQISAITKAFADRPLLVAWIVFAIYGAGAAALVQFLVLPLLAPSLHAGHGLLVGQDSIGYHATAAEMAASIRQSGWSAWSLAPQGQTPAGLAAPFYYLIAAEPWSLIPVNAALQATAGIIVMQLIRQLGVATPIAFAGAALWVGLPSTLQWVTQIQKDCYYFTGMLGVLLGWTLLLRAPVQKSALPRIFAAGVVLCAGVVFAGAARVYGLLLIGATGAVISIVAVAFLVRPLLTGKAEAKYCLAAMCLFILLPIALQFTPHDRRLNAELAAAKGSFVEDSYLAKQTILDKWHPSAILPNSIDKCFLRLSVARQGYVGETYRNAGSMIDLDIQFSNAEDIASYLPRALQIGFFAPFPSKWFSAGTSPGGTIMRAVVGLEMMLLYPLLLFGLPMAIWRWRHLPEFWLIIIFCVPIVLAYTYTTPNLGTLHRLRYGFFTMLAALGLAAILMTLHEWQGRRSH